jgi:uncharacterized membrane protein (DUF485 family)
MATPVHETEQVAPPTAPPAPAPALDSDEAALDAVAAKRWRVAMALTGAMLVVYFGFILLIAFAKDFMGRTITEGLSVGMALGVLVILSTWALTWAYVRWANRVYEPALDRLRR